MLSLFKPQSIIGLTIDEDYCYFLRYSTSRKAASVIYETGSAPFASLAKQLKSWGFHPGFRKPVVRLAIMAREVFVKVVRFPCHFSDNDREIDIQMHLSQYFPEAPEALSFDFCFLYTLDDQDFYCVFAISTQIIHSYGLLLQNIGFKLIGVDIDICVLLRLLSAKPPFNLIYLTPLKKYLIKMQNNAFTFETQFDFQKAIAETYLLGDPLLCQAHSETYGGEIINPLAATTLESQFLIPYGLVT